MAASVLLELQQTMPWFVVLVDGNMICNGAPLRPAVKPGGVDRDAIEARLGAAGRPICAAHRRPPDIAGQVLDTAARKTALSRQTAARTVVPSAGSARHVSVLQRASYRVLAARPPNIHFYEGMASGLGAILGHL